MWQINSLYSQACHFVPAVSECCISPEQRDGDSNAGSHHGYGYFAQIQQALSPT